MGNWSLKRSQSQPLAEIVISVLIPAAISISGFGIRPSAIGKIFFYNHTTKRRVRFGDTLPQWIVVKIAELQTKNVIPYK